MVGSDYAQVANRRIHIWTTPSQNPARMELAGHLADAFPCALHGQSTEELDFFWRMDVAPTVVGYPGAMVVGADRMAALAGKVRAWAEHRSCLLDQEPGGDLADQWAVSHDAAREILLMLQGYLGPSAAPEGGGA